MDYTSVKTYVTITLGVRRQVQHDAALDLSLFKAKTEERARRPALSGKSDRNTEPAIVLTSMKSVIREMLTNDWEAVRQIYLEGIATGHATFETEAPSWSQWDATHLSIPRLVACDAENGDIQGWASLAPVSKRKVYSGVAEVSVYVSEHCRGHGIGKKLLEELIRQSELSGIWTLQASVFPENLGTIALHQSCGFRQVGRREKIGELSGVWRDTLLLEKRTKMKG